VGNKTSLLLKAFFRRTGLKSLKKSKSAAPDTTRNKNSFVPREKMVKKFPVFGKVVFDFPNSPAGFIRPSNLFL
jgi:hypothetical protein